MSQPRAQVVYCWVHSFTTSWNTTSVLSFLVLIFVIASTCSKNHWHCVGVHLCCRELLLGIIITLMHIVPVRYTPPSAGMQHCRGFIEPPCIYSSTRHDPPTSLMRVQDCVQGCWPMERLLSTPVGVAIMWCLGNNTVSTHQLYERQTLVLGMGASQL